MRDGIIQQLMCCARGKGQLFHMNRETMTNSGGRSTTMPSVSTVPMRNIAMAGMGAQGRMNMAFAQSNVMTKIG